MRPADALGATNGAASDGHIFAFGGGASEGDPSRKDLLGGKGASLAAMSRAGFPVPPGFTISAACCEDVERTGAWPPGLEEEVRRAIARLEAVTGRTSPPKVMNHSHGSLFFAPPAEPALADDLSSEVKAIADQRSFCRKIIVP